EGCVSVPVEGALSQFGINRLDRVSDTLQTRPVGGPGPGPQVTKPQRRQDVQLGGLGTAIVNRDLDEDVFRRFLGVLDEDVEVAIFIKHTGVEQLVLELIAAAAAIGLN